MTPSSVAHTTFVIDRRYGPVGGTVKQGAFFDELDNAKDREEGSRALFDALGAYLAGRKP